MLASPKYDEQSYKITLLGREYVITSLTPKLKKEDEQKAKEEIQGKLFNVFKKYV